MFPLSHAASEETKVYGIEYRIDFCSAVLAGLTGRDERWIRAKMFLIPVTYSVVGVH